VSIESLSAIIATGQPTDVNRDTLAEQAKQAIDGLFGTRYQARSRYSARAALMPGSDAVSFAGLVHEDSPTSGVYGGMSLIWFPVEAVGEHEAGSLLVMFPQLLPPNSAIAALVVGACVDCWFVG